MAQARPPADILWLQPYPDRRAGEVNISSFEFDDPTEAELERRERLAAG